MTVEVHNNINIRKAHIWNSYILALESLLLLFIVLIFKGHTHVLIVQLNWLHILNCLVILGEWKIQIHHAVLKQTKEKIQLIII